MSVQVIVDEVGPLLQRLKSAAQAQGIALVGARAVATLVKEHLYGLDGQRHRAGGGHFYRKAADSVNSVVVPQGAAVNITQRGFRQRLQGGPIRPKPGHALAIPVEGTAAVGRTPREFNDLDIGRAMDDRGRLRWALIRRVSTAISYVRRKRKDGSYSFKVRAGDSRLVEPLFWLSFGVDQKPDRSVLPYAEQMALRANDAMRSRLLRLADRASRAADEKEPSS